MQNASQRLNDFLFFIFFSKHKIESWQNIQNDKGVNWNKKGKKINIEINSIQVHLYWNIEKILEKRFNQRLKQIMSKTKITCLQLPAIALEG